MAEVASTEDNASTADEAMATLASTVDEAVAKAVSTVDEDVSIIASRADEAVAKAYEAHGRCGRCSSASCCFSRFCRCRAHSGRGTRLWSRLRHCLRDDAIPLTT